MPTPQLRANIKTVPREIHFTEFFTDQLRQLNDRDKQRLQNALADLYQAAFPKMPASERQLFINDYFRASAEHHQRQGFLVHNEIQSLAAAVIFDLTQIHSTQGVLAGLYLISRAIAPEYQGAGLGKTLAAKVLTHVKPDLFFTTCTQSSSLHSWLNLAHGGIISGYHVFPRLEISDGQERLITVPEHDLAFILAAFQQCYLYIVEGNSEQVKQATQNLTRRLVRKNMYDQRYHFNPWQKDGRVDRLAQALGAAEKDGVLVVFRKQTDEQIRID